MQVNSNNPQMTTPRTNTKTVIKLFSALLLISSLGVSHVSAQQAEGLALPDDIAAREQGSELQQQRRQNLQIEEQRVGDNLERITVQRENGINDIYENSHNDSLWVHEEDQLGDQQTVRRWTIGSW